METLELDFDAETVQSNAKRLVELLARGMGEADDAVYDYDYERRVKEIESEPRDGFWPWTSGGYEVTLPAALAHHWGTGNAPGPINPLIEAGEQFIIDAWSEQFPDRPALLACIHGETDEARKFQSEAETFEAEAWSADDDVYFWKARAIYYRPGDFGADADMDEPYVHIDAYLNTDLNCGRDHIRWLRCYGQDPNRTVGDFTRRIPLREFAALTDAQLREIANEAVASLP